MHCCVAIAKHASHLRGELWVCGELLQLFQQGIVELVLVKFEQLLHEAGISQLLFGLIPSGRLLEDCHDSRQGQLHKRRWFGIRLHTSVL